MSVQTLDGRDDATVLADRPYRVLIGLAGLQLGGCQINAVDLAAGLLARGHDVRVFAVADDSVKVSILPYAARADVPITLVSGARGLFSRARSVRRLTIEHRSELVHVFAPWLGIVAGVSVVGTRAAVVVTNWNMVNSFWGPARSPLVVGTGDLVREAMPRHRGPVHLMTPPIDTEADRPNPVAGSTFRRDHGIAEDDLLVVLVSRVDRDMKLESITTAMTAVERWANGPVRLVIVGDGDAHDEVAARAVAANERVGRPLIDAPGSMLDPRPAYAAADILLAMGGAALRGMAHGRPVVVLGEQGFARLYEPAAREYFDAAGFYGLGCAADPADHLLAILTPLSDPSVRAQLGAIGRADVEARFGLGAGLDNLQDIYAGAISRRPSRVGRWTDAAVLLTRSLLGTLRQRTSHES